MLPLPGALARYIEGLKSHDLDAIASAVSDQVRFVTPSRVLDKSAFLSMLRAFYTAFPDWAYGHNEPEVRGESVTVLWRQGGTHTGPFDLPGARRVEPTGRTVKIPEQRFFYIVRVGAIVEIRPDPIPGGAPDGILEQLGLSNPAK